MSLLSCRNLSLGYEGRKVIEDLSFEVHEGDYLCIVGENGSGKSTLIKTILGLLPPITGEVSMGDGLLQTEIGYLPQQTVVQKDFPASVHEVVLSGCLNSIGLRPFYGAREKRRVAEAMQRLGIEDLTQRCYRDLSGGQQQRVLLARALCATKKLLLLDEPVAGLDPNASASMYRLLEEINERDGITIVMISHDISSALPYASQVLHMGRQRALFFGPQSEYDIARYVTYGSISEDVPEPTTTGNGVA